MKKCCLVLLMIVVSVGLLPAEKSGFLTIDLSPDHLVPDAPVGGETMIGHDLWLGLAVGLNVFTINLNTREYDLGIAPGVGWGIKWRPEFWTLSQSFLGLDAFFHTSLIESDDALSGFDFFSVTVLPVLTVGNLVSIGVGVAAQIALHQGVDDQIDTILSIGVGTAIESGE